MEIKSIIFILFCSITLYSSHLSENDMPSEEALALAKGNRPELERVLDYYSDDSLKLEAATFIVRNMSGHTSYAATPSLAQYSIQCDSIILSMLFSSRISSSESLNKCANPNGIPVFQKVSDIAIIQSDYLIKHNNDYFWKDMSI